MPIDELQDGLKYFDVVLPVKIIPTGRVDPDEIFTAENFEWFSA